MMKKWIFTILLLSLLFFPLEKTLAQDYFCAFYFTYIGCPNCAHTDPVVLTKWTKNYPNLVIIEYAWHGGDWQNPNSQFFGEYASAYETQPAVPQIIIDKNNIRLGRIEVPKAEEDIKGKKKNPCPLINKTVPFGELDLSQLQGKPKIWANGRVLIKLDEDKWLFQWTPSTHQSKESLLELVGKEEFAQGDLKRLLFSENVFEELKNKNFNPVDPQKVEFSGSAFPGSEFVPFHEFENAIEIKLSKKQGVPPIEQNTETKENLSSQKEINSKIEEEVLEIPFIGKIKSGELSLPVLTFLIGLADGFNPCAFFVLSFLLAALIGLAGARKKILLVGSIFIFFSALFYFLFMSVWFNVFQLGGRITALTIIAGLIAIFAGIVNIKDYFYFQKGISLTLPKSSKEKFLARVKKLSLANSTWALIIGTTVIAATVNIYELLCTFGFPTVYVRILTLRELSTLEYYLYLIFYNLVYIIPLAIIVLIFAITLGKKTFSQIWVRRFKLASGFMILFLGLILIANPKLLESPLTAFLSLFVAIIISAIIILIDIFCCKGKPKSLSS